MADNQIIENGNLDFNARATELTGLASDANGNKPKLQHVRITKATGSGANVTDTDVDFATQTTLAQVKTNLDTLIARGMQLPAYDYISATYPTATQEVYTYKTGGSGGSTVATVTINYTDSTKANILNVSKS